FGNLPFYPNTVTKPWEPRHGVRRAAVSSFGFGGTNAHVIVEEGPAGHKPWRETLPPTPWKRKRHWVDGLFRNTPEVYLSLPDPFGTLASHPSAPPAAVPEPTPRAIPAPATVKPEAKPNAVSSPEPTAAKKAAPPNPIPSAEQLPALKGFLKQKIAATLRLDAGQIDENASFLEMGLDSMTVMELTNAIQQEKSIELYPTLLFEYTNINDLAAFLLEKHPGIAAPTDRDATASVRPAEPRVVSAPTAVAPANAGRPEVALTPIKAYLREKIALTLKVDPNRVSDGDSFIDLGLDSMTVMELTHAIQQEKSIELYPTLLFEYTTINDLAAYLFEKHPGIAATPAGTRSARPLGVSGASAPNPAPQAMAATTADALSPIKGYLKEKIALTLKIDAGQIGDGASFLELGLDSMTVMELTNAMQEDLGIELYPTLLFEYTNVHDLAAYLRGKNPGKSEWPRGKGRIPPES
ncbi:MAG: hypothetical protein J0L75_15740, partial [Spirochaetes bacterium]|nr:hypothetical protein [Spirochaetota bacterium]